MTKKTLDEGTLARGAVADHGKDVAPDIIAAIDILEKRKQFHEDEAGKIGKQLADIRDRLNGRARTKRSGKFTRKRKGVPATPSVADASIGQADYELGNPPEVGRRG